jgi:hypothetical protein
MMEQKYFSNYIEKPLYSGFSIGKIIEKAS